MSSLLQDGLNSHTSSETLSLSSMLPVPPCLSAQFQWSSKQMNSDHYLLLKKRKYLSKSHTNSRKKIKLLGCGKKVCLPASGRRFLSYHCWPWLLCSSTLECMPFYEDGIDSNASMSFHLFSHPFIKIFPDPLPTEQNLIHLSHPGLLSLSYAVLLSFYPWL